MTTQAGFYGEVTLAELFMRTAKVDALCKDKFGRATMVGLDILPKQEKPQFFVTLTRVNKIGYLGQILVKVRDWRDCIVPENRYSSTASYHVFAALLHTAELNNCDIRFYHNKGSMQRYLRYHRNQGWRTVLVTNEKAGSKFYVITRRRNDN